MRRHIGGAVAALLLVSSTAHAQEPSFQYPPGWSPIPPPVEPTPDDIEEGRDVRVRTAAGVTGLAVGVLAAGLATYGAAASNEECGLTGCFAKTNPQLEIAAGAIGAAGAGMALVAVPTLLDAMFVDRGPPRRAGRMGWGLALTSIGAGSAASMIVLGLAFHEAEKDRFDFRTRGPGTTLRDPDRVDAGGVLVSLIAQGVVAAVHLGVGIPLWASGGRSGGSGDSSFRATIVPTGSGAAVQGSF
jgi:hypothetical protein